MMMKKLLQNLFLLLVLTVTTLTAIAQTSDLFISEYIEGNSNNKAIEFYNPTSDTLSLENYRIAISANGGGWTAFRSFPAGATLAPGAVWVIANSQTTPALLSGITVNEMVSYSTGVGLVVSFNGDDARGLIKINGTDTLWLDVFGTPNLDPGSAWDVGGVAGGTANRTLVRKSFVSTGNNNWAESALNEWDVYNVDDFSHLGSHFYGLPTFTLSLHVNMNYQITSGNFNPLTDSVDVAGSMNDWLGTLMSDSDNDGIYSVEIADLNAGDTVYFKFRINANWNTSEFPGGDNRSYIVTNGTNEQTYWYNDNSGPQLVTFTINDQPGNYLNIKMKGAWDNWMLHQMYDDGTNGDALSGDDIWTCQVLVPGGTYEWGAIEDDGSQWGLWLIQGPNMQITVATDGTVSGQLNYDVPLPGTNTVVFNVNMNVQIDLGNFNPLTDSLDVAGSFSLWGTAGNMTDPDGDGIYTISVDGFAPNQLIEFKFRINEDWALAEFPNGGPNRSYTVIGGGSDNITFWYSDQLPASLFFSEYIEGSSNNKALEIFNPSQDTVFLADYRIAQSNNGGGWQYYHPFPNGASIAPGDVWVIITSQTLTSLFDPANADEVLAFVSNIPTGNVTHHNGDDARGIVRISGNDTLLLDVIGIPTNDPGTAWPVAGVSNATAEKTLIRKTGIYYGNTNWEASAGTTTENSEWIILPQNTFTYLGSHPHPELTSGTVTFNVNMNYQITLGNFNPTIDFVDVAGSFNNWMGSAAMTDLDGDFIYSITVQNITPGVHEFKFRINGSWNTAEPLPSNRVYTVILGTQTVTYWYNDQEPVYPVSIYQIQYTTDPSGNSPYAGSMISTSGIVTATLPTGYYIQDGQGAWNGIFVYDAVNTPSIGDNITINGVVSEYYGLTEITTVNSYVLMSNGNTLPLPVVITTYELSSAEAYEGVLVTVENAEYVTQANNYNEWYVNDGSGACQIDDAIYNYTPFAVFGNSYTITGVVNYSFSAYELNPRSIDDIQDVTVVTSTQEIPLVPGWRIISTYITPPNPNVIDVFAGIVQNLIILKNGTGNIYWVNYNLNTIGNLVLGQGYQINMSQPDTLIVSGLMAEPENTLISIPANWSILGYLRTTPGNSIGMMAGLNANNLVIMKNGVGSVYWPQWGLNSIGNMNPGEGYQIKLSSPQTFSFPANSGQGGNKTEAPLKPSIRPTGANMTIGFPAFAWSQTPASGSVIRVLNAAGQVVGLSEVTPGTLAITVWGDDEMTSNLDGAVDFESLRFELVNHGVNTPLEISSWIQGDGTYKTNDIQVAGKINSLARFDLSVWPNPAKTTSSIYIELMESGTTLVQVFNILGEKVKDVYVGYLDSGQHVFNVNVDDLSSGNYLVKVSQAANTTTKKLQVIR
jgi:hypothetical protein